MIKRWRERRRQVRVIREQYGYVPADVAVEWYREDQEFNREVDRRLRIASTGVDLSFMDGRPK